MTGDSQQGQHQLQPDTTGQPIWTRWGLLDMIVPLVCWLVLLVGSCACFLNSADTFDGPHVGLPSPVKHALIGLGIAATLVLALRRLVTNKALSRAQGAVIALLVVAAGVGLVQLIPQIRYAWYHHVCVSEDPPEEEGARHRACRVVVYLNMKYGFSEEPACALHLRSCLWTLEDGPASGAPPWTLRDACEPLLEHDCVAELPTVCAMESASAFSEACERAHAPHSDEPCAFFTDELCPAVGAYQRSAEGEPAPE